MRVLRRAICFVGLPGSGKSVVGKALAKRLGVSFLDSDEEIERLIPGTIKQFFATQGEARFRELEADVIHRLCTSHTDQYVISTGGGAVLNEANRITFGQNAVVIYLCASPGELVRRLRHDTRRPLLQGGQLAEKLTRMYEVRDPLYREVATFTIETGRPTVQALVGMILMQLELAGLVDPTQVPSLVDPSVPKAERSA